MKLISLKNVESMCNNGELVLQKGQVITPSAKDFLKNKGIRVIYLSDKCRTIDSSNQSQEQLIQKITNILVKDYGISDKQVLSELIITIMKQI